jgi:hypothetical protein
MDPTFRGVDGRWRLLPVFQRQKKTTNSPQNLNLINAPPIRKQKQQDKCLVRIKQVNAYPSVLEQAFLLRSLMYFRTKDHSNYVRSDTRTFSDVRHESRRFLTSVTTFSPFLSSVTTFLTSVTTYMLTSVVELHCILAISRNKRASKTTHVRTER